MKEHESVLLEEALEFLNVKKGKRYIDATVGAGGHARAICSRGGSVFGIDRDLYALTVAERNLRQACPDSVLVHTSFASLARVAQEHNFVSVDGVLFDLGVSSMQLDGPGRGFSWRNDEPLDMRMDTEGESVTARDLVNALREDQLYELFSLTSERRLAHTAARAIVRARATSPINTTGQLAGVIEDVYKGRSRAIHPATTIFMALRIAVNNEYEELQRGLEGALEILGSHGRLVVISFHSGEDRVVKEFLKQKSKTNEMTILTKKPIIPGLEEVGSNPRARSAKLRVGEKI